MGVITITDLPTNLSLDLKAMSSIRGGGGAPWVYSFPRFGGASKEFSPSVMNNFYQVNNNYFAENMINNIQAVSINNFGDKANINAVLVSA